MIFEKINLKDFYNLETNPLLTVYAQDNFTEIDINRKRKCVLILPGGAYAYTSRREAEPVALKFLNDDICAFVLNYTCAPFTYPTPFVEVFAALSFIRRNSEKYHVDVNQISVVGFSAGGHLAASCSAYHTSMEFANYLGISLDEMKINGCILGYPVISKDFGHAESFKNVTQGREDLREKLSIENQVTKDFPKTFIWHTTFDASVPVKNSLALAEKLSENNIFFELHVYPMHGHGQSVCDRTVYNENVSDQIIEEMKYNTQWIGNAIHFIKEYL